MSRIPVLSLLLAAIATGSCFAACSSESFTATADAGPGGLDANGDTADSNPGTLDSSPGTLDASPGTLDASPGTPDAGALDASTDAGSSADGGADAADGGNAAAQDGVVEIVAGGRHTCARLIEGTVKCWGANEAGQLGLGDGQSRGLLPGQMGSSLPTVDLGPGRTAVRLAVGAGHTCAVLDNGTAKCWGQGSMGQLGLGSQTNRGDEAGEMGANLPSIDVGPGRTVLEIAAGWAHTCARLDDGSVKCWGYGSYGQLGLGDPLTRGRGPTDMGSNLPAVDLGPGRTAVQLSTGYTHTCAVLDDQTVKCWGSNAAGYLGVGGGGSDRGTQPGDMGANLPPIDLGPGRTVKEVGTGRLYSCARLDDGTVKCWGDNYFGQLGLGDRQGRGASAAQMGANLPALDLGLGRTATRLVVGNAHACALLDDGSTKCWGGNGIGKLGVGDANDRGDVPGEMGASLPSVDLGPGRRAAQLTAGTSHTCARLDDGTAKCWGNSASGELGLGSSQSRGDAPGEMGVNLPVVMVR